MRVENQGPGPSKDHILQIEQGGTSAATNEQALRNLGAIAVEEINKPNGIAGYEFGTTKVPEYILPHIAGGGNSPTIEGPMSIALGDSAILKITNFDSFTDYVVSYHRFTGQRNGDTIFITASSYGNDGNVTVNGSVFNINVTIANPPLLGEVVFREATPDQVTDLKNTDTVANVLVARAVKEFVGSLNAGEVQLYQRNGETGLVSQHILSPAIIDTVITYTGQGAKKFTANNQVFNRTGNGSITFTGAGNILIEGVGDTITTPPTPPQGLPQYPSGLPPYIAPVPGTPGQGNASYPAGLPPYTAPVPGTPGQGNASYPAGLPPYVAPVPGQGNASYPAGLPPYVAPVSGSPGQGNASYPAGLPPYTAPTQYYNYSLSPQQISIVGSAPDPNRPYRVDSSTDTGSNYPPAEGTTPLSGTWTIRITSMTYSYTDAQGGGGSHRMSYFTTITSTLGRVEEGRGLAQYPSGLPPYVAPVPGTPGQGNASYPSGLPPYIAPVPGQGNASYPSGLPPYIAPVPGTPGQGNASYPSGLPPYIAPVPGTPGQGNASYPSGLPPYNPGSPGSSSLATLTFVSNTFQITGTNINQTVYPFKNYRLGQAITMAENGTYASGQTLETTERLGLGGEVIIIHNDGTRKKQHINVAYSAPHPRFGASVKLKSDASHLLVGSPGINRVSLYRNVSNNFEQPTLTTPSGIASTARFGEHIEANDAFTRVFVYAPGEGTNGAVYIYSMSANALTFIEKITLPTLPNGFKPAMDMRSVADINKLYFNAYNSTTQTYVVVEFTRVAGLWNVTKTFDNPNPGTPDLFGSYYSVSEDGRVVAISSIGASGMKGVLNIWVNVDDKWVFFDSVIDEEAEFGDQFGKFISLATNGKNAVTIHRRNGGSNGDDILYLK